MTIKSEVARGLKWQVISIAGRQILSLVIFTTLARLLDPSSFGLIGLVGVYLGFVAMFADQGIGAALIQRQNLTPEHLDTAFWFNLSCASLLCLGTWVLAEPVSTLFGEPRLIPLLRWSSLGLIISAASTIHATLFLKEMDFRRPTIRVLIANAVGGAVGVGMALSGYGVWALVGQQLSLALTGTVFLWAVSTYRPSLRFSRVRLRELLRVSLSVFASSFLWFLSSRLDQFFIGRFIGVPSLGLYVIAGKLPEVGKMVATQPIAEVSLPALSRLQNDQSEMRKMIYRGMEINAIISFAIFVGMAAVAKDMLPFLFGGKWIGAASVCSLLSLYTLLNTLSVFIHPALLASGGAGKYVLLNASHAIGVLIACIIGVHFGLVYLVLGLIINGLVITIPALLFLRNRIGLIPLEYCKPCIAPAFASLFMVAVIWITGIGLSGDLTPALCLTFKIAAGASAYVCFMFFFKRDMLVKLLEIARHSFGFRQKQTASEMPAIIER